jgi:dienelactone hydrolase
MALMSRSDWGARLLDTLHAGGELHLGEAPGLDSPRQLAAERDPEGGPSMAPRHLQLRPRLPRTALLTAITVGFLATPSCAPPSPTESDITITAPDGVELAATYFTPGKPGPGVLLLHMCNSDRSAWSRLGTLLAERGIHALALDYRGYGGSGGERGETPQESQAIRAEKWAGDVDAAFGHLTSRSGVDGERLGAAGGSCGVDQAVKLARRHPEVETLVLLAGSSDRASEELLERSPWMPIFGSASRDDGVAVDITSWLVGFSSNPRNVFVDYAEGGHGTEMFAVHAELEPRIADWFEEHLITNPVEVPETVEAKPGPSAELAVALREPGPLAQLREQLRTAREAGRAESVELPPEGVINLYGYELLAEGKSEEAIEVFLLNVDAHPDSANTYDSLGDAYLAAGERELAAESSAKTLAALPDDASEDTPFEAQLREAAEAKLQEIRGGGAEDE